MTRTTLLFTLAGLASTALAQPQGTQVVRGSATITRTGDLTQIHAANNTILNHQSFDIASGSAVQFIQPSATSRVLNRINSATPTHIDGSLLANGRVYLVNQAGVFFGRNSIVNTGALIAAAGKMSDQDFLRGVDRFTNLTGDVVNSGAISAGDVILAGAHVANSGTITADRSAILVSGDNVLLRQSSASNIYVKVGTVSQGITQPRTSRSLGAGDALGTSFASHTTISTGTISGRSVHVESSGDASVSGTLSANATSFPNSHQSPGSIQVLGNTVNVHNASITATGDTAGGSINIGGGYQGTGDLRRSYSTTIDSTTTIDSSATNTGNAGNVVVWSDGHTAFEGSILSRGGKDAGNGGSVEVSGKATLDFIGSVNASAFNGTNGTLLLDPKNINITAAGVGSPTTATFTNNPSSSSSISLSTLLSLLGSNTNVTLQANNDLTWTDGETNFFTSTATLTLQAGRSIIIDPANNGFVKINASALNISMIANDSVGVIGAGTQANRDAGLGNITTGNLTTGGDISLTLRGVSGLFLPGTISLGNLVANRLTINTGGSSVTQIDSNRSIIANQLALLSSGGVATFTLNNDANSIIALAGNVSGSVSLHNTGTLELNEVGSSSSLAASIDVNLVVNQGTLQQFVPIITPTFSAQVNFTGAGTGITLNNASNDVSNVSLRSFQSDGSTMGARHISFRDANGFNITGMSTGATLTLSGTDTIIQSAPITATVGLFITTRNDSGADIILDTQQNQTNTIGFLAYNSLGNVVAPAEVRYYDADGFTIADLSTTACAFLRTASADATITQANPIAPHNLALRTGNWTLTDPANTINGIASTGTSNINIATAGPMTITSVCGVNGVNTSGYARLIASNFINQDQPVTAGLLIARALNSAQVTLENASNNVAQLTLESRNVNNTDFANGALNYRDADGFAVLRLGTTNNTSLLAGGAVTQVGSNSPIITGALNLQGGSSASYTLDRTDNAFTVLTGDANFANVFSTLPIIVGSYAGSSGFNVSSFLRMITLGTISQSSPITGDLVVARTMNNAGAQIFLNNPANNMQRINLQVRNAVNTAFASNDILYADSNGYSVVALGTHGRASLVSAGGSGVTQVGASLPITAGALHVSGPAPYTLDNPTNSFPLFAGNASSLNLFTSTPLTFGTVFSGVGASANSFLRVQARGDITQTAPIFGTLLVARTLNDSLTQVLLTNQSNNFAQINMQSRNAANSDFGGGRIVYADTNGYSIVSLGTNEQAILRAAGPVDQAGALLPITVGGGIRLLGSGSFTLNNVNNAIPALAGSAGRTEVFTTTPLFITQLGVASGYVSTGDVVLTTRGAITQDRFLRGVNLSATTLNNAGASIILTTPGNLFSGTKTLRARNAINTADVAATLQYSE